MGCAEIRGLQTSVGDVKRVWFRSRIWCFRKQAAECLTDSDSRFWAEGELRGGHEEEVSIIPGVRATFETLICETSCRDEIRMTSSRLTAHPGESHQTADYQERSGSGSRRVPFRGPICASSGAEDAFLKGRTPEAVGPCPPAIARSWSAIRPSRPTRRPAPAGGPAGRSRCATGPRAASGRRGVFSAATMARIDRPSDLSVSTSAMVRVARPGRRPAARRRPWPGRRGHGPTVRNPGGRRHFYG